MSANTGTNNRLIAVKAVLWFLLGAAAVVTAVRYARGLGLTTNLTDTTPWGLWIGFDVLSGVALGAGGFVIAAVVYVFGRERYHGIARPAVLTAFLGYLGVIIGLMVDLGRPWNIWRPLFHQNLHSPLFEVAMCVMLYTTVLALEFAPVGLERFNWARPLVRGLRRMLLPLVILGISLSTLHQSSLGSLFLLTGPRMHPLWYSPLQSPLFLISAIGLGLAMVTLEGIITSWLYRRKTEWPQFAGLTRAAAVVLPLYLAVRLIDLGVRGQLGYAVDGSGFAILFWIEIAMTVVLPVLLFTLPGTRGRNWATGWGALSVVAGFILHRANVGGISNIAVTGEAYLPAPTELITSLGIVAGLALVFLFFVEKLNVWEERPEEPGLYTPAAFDPVGRMYVRGPWLGGGQRAVMALIAGAVVGLVAVEAQLAERSNLQASPVDSPRTVMMTPADIDGILGRTVATTTTDEAGTVASRALLIDSGGAGRYVLFEHAAHEARLGGAASCAGCHHRNLPLDRATSCARCHADMYRVTDTFSHASHERALGGRASCVGCHVDPEAPKTRAGARACNDCHHPAVDAPSLVQATLDLGPGLAPGYMDAMHGLCRNCHIQRAAAVDGSDRLKTLDQCATCHRTGLSDREELIRRSLALAEVDGGTPVDGAPRGLTP